MEHMEKRYLCLDTGGTSVKYCLGDRQGTMWEEGKIPTEKTREAFLQSIQDLYQKLGPVDGVACSFPGEVHDKEGMILGISAVEHLHEFPLKEAISNICGGVPVTMVNDANAAALGEAWKGAAKGRKNAAFVIVGTGVGGAVIENGTLYPGTTFNKAEIGNFLMGGTDNGNLLAWSDFTMEKQVRKFEKQYHETIDGRELVRRARMNDEKALPLLKEFLHYMAVGCILVEFAYDPEVIVIGGGISADTELISAIQKEVEQLVAGQRMGYLIPTIVPCQYQNGANLLGALYHFVTSYPEDKESM